MWSARNCFCILLVACGHRFRWLVLFSRLNFNGGLIRHSAPISIKLWGWEDFCFKPLKIPPNLFYLYLFHISTRDLSWNFVSWHELLIWKSLGGAIKTTSSSSFLEKHWFTLNRFDCFQDTSFNWLTLAAIYQLHLSVTWSVDVNH